MIALFAAAALAIDPLLCEQRSALKFVPSMSSTSLGEWRQLQAGSAYAVDATLAMNASILRLLATPSSQSPISGFEYTLPRHSGASGAGSAWLYDLNYTFAQNVNNRSCVGSLGAWHVVGFDWGAPGSAPNLTAVRFASGATDARGVMRVSGATCRIRDVDIACPLDGGLNSSVCDSFLWPTRAVPDVGGELRVARYQFLFDGHLLHPTSVQTEFGEQRGSQLERAAVAAPEAWRAPTRLVYLSTCSVFLLFQFKLARVELGCPAESVSSTSETTTGATASSSTQPSQPLRSDGDTSSSTQERRATASQSTLSANVATTGSQRSTSASSTQTATAALPTTRLGAIDPVTEPADTAAWSQAVAIGVGVSIGLLVGLGCPWLCYAMRTASRWGSLSEKKHVGDPTSATALSCCVPVESVAVAVGDPAPSAQNSIYGPIDPSASRGPITYDVVMPQTRTSQYGPVPAPQKSDYDQPESPLN